MAEIRVNSTGGVKLFDADDSHYAQIKAGTISSNTDVLELGSSAVVAGTKVDLNGQELILDADADTSITADTDDQIDVRIAGADDFQFTANTFTAQSGSSIVVPDGGLTFGSTAISSTAAELNILDGVTSTAAELNILDGVTSTAAELNIVDGNTSATSTTIADADRVVLNDNGTMVQAAVTDLKTYIGGALTSLGSSDSNDAAGDVTFDNVFSDTYSRYIIYIDTMMPVDDGASLYFRFRKSDGSGGYEDESRTGYVYHVRHIRNGSTSDYNDGASSGGAQTFGRISGAVKNSTGEHGLKAIVNVYRPGTRQSQATMTYVRCDGTYRSHANDDSMSVILSSACNNYHTDAMLGIKFYFSGGNIDDNKIRVYGVTT